jgi:hypothetical protein
MPVYLTPGVYRQPRRTEQRDIRLVRTDVAGFAGFAERGPLPSPTATLTEAAGAAVRLTSWNEFLATFGGFMVYSYLAYAVRAFFENGGRTCYVVRVASLKPQRSAQGPRKAFYTLPSTPSHPIDTPILVAKVKAGDSTLTILTGNLRNTGEIMGGNLVEISGAGATESLMVVERQNNVIRLAQKLKHDYAEGTALSKHEAGFVATATSEGAWGNRINLEITPLMFGDAAREFALRVTLARGRDPSQPIGEEFYNHLSVVKGPFYAPDRVNNFSDLITLSVPEPLVNIVDSSRTAPPLFVKSGPLASGVIRLQGGQDGLSEVSLEDFIGGSDDFRGLRLLEEIDEVSILCVPDAVFERPAALLVSKPPSADPCAKVSSEKEPPSIDPASIYSAMIDQCERLRDRVAILDYPQNQKTPRDLKNWRNQFSTRFGAIYYPWLKVPDPLEIEGPTRRLPAAGHVAGVYAWIDNQFGVDRPPANVALDFATDVVEALGDLDQQELNPHGINVIRPFPGRGIRVWGARSLAGSDDPNWEFIHVRRLMSMIEESVDKSMKWAVFEPNDFALRQTLAHSLSVFLEAIWRQGGLKGARPSDGFYVKCDETNNPSAVVEAGQIICEIGVAVAAPMEFLIFEIRQEPDGFSVNET